MNFAALRHRIGRVLPTGRTLPEAYWRRRHHAIVWLMWAQAGGLVLFALAQGFGLGHSLLESLPVVGCAVAASTVRLGRRARTAFAAIGLLTCSAVLVHIWDGRTEAHFHFFVMVTVLALYEAWIPYLLGVAYVVLHHGTAGVLAPSSVYDHTAAVEDPWGWAAVHGLFIGGLAVANITAWRLNESMRTQATDAHARTAASEARFRSAFEDAPVGMALVDRAGRLLRANRQLAKLTGWSVDELLERTLDDLAADGEPWRPSVSGADAEERRFRRADGECGWCQWQQTLVEDPEPYWICQFVDVSRRKRAESELSYQARHDPLTGLPNRTMFVHRLQDALARRDGETNRVAVLFVDVDDFKLINDSLGHGAGDRLLVAVGERLRRVVRPSDLLARFGGDEFTVCLEEVSDVDHARQIAERLASALRAPFVLDGQQRFITASVGIVLDNGHEGAEGLLADADAAMYRAKELGKARVELFDDSMRARVIERLELETGLREALARDELRLDYQPAVDLASNAVTSVEALLRWDHPRLGLIPPDRFIPIAERTGLILPIGGWVVREACAQLAAWRGERVPHAADLVMAVNVSARQLVSETLVGEVAAALEGAGVDADRLCLEVTESAVIADPDAALATLHALKELGVRLAIDDFGIGYSSLGSLRDLLPVDILKIDRSFVGGMERRDEDRAIVESVVSLAHSLGLGAVAEGVETAEQAAALRGMGCSHAQGFHYAQPSRPGAVAELLRRHALGELDGLPAGGASGQLSARPGA